MDASKENCRLAHARLALIWSGVPGEVRRVMQQDFDLVRSFLLASERKLPKQCSFDKERNRGVENG